MVSDSKFGTCGASFLKSTKPLALYRHPYVRASSRKVEQAFLLDQGDRRFADNSRPRHGPRKWRHPGLLRMKRSAEPSRPITRILPLVEGGCPIRTLEVNPSPKQIAWGKGELCLPNRMLQSQKRKEATDVAS